MVLATVPLIGNDDKTDEKPKNIRPKLGQLTHFVRNLDTQNQNGHDDGVETITKGIKLFG